MSEKILLRVEQETAMDSEKAAQDPGSGETMPRVNSAVLTCRDGKHYYGDAPFTGVGFDVEGCIVAAATEYRGGVAVRPYLSEYLSRVEDLATVPGVVLECLDEDERNFFDDIPFTGIAYDFSDEMCVAEVIFKEGVEGGSYVDYYPSGKVECVFLRYGDTVEECAWYEDGAIRKFKLAKAGQGISLTIEPDGTVSFLDVSDGYFPIAAAISPRIAPNPFAVWSSITALKGSERMFVSGGFVDDGMLGDMISQGIFRGTNELVIHSDKLTTTSLDLLRPLANVKALEIESEHILLYDAMRFLSQRHDCTVSLNHLQLRLE